MATSAREVSELIKMCHTAREPIYRYFYKGDICPFTLPESEHIYYIKKVKNQSHVKADVINSLDRIVHKLCQNLNSDNTYKFGSISSDECEEFRTNVIILVENNWIQNDEMNGYLKYTLDRELMVKPFEDILGVHIIIDQNSLTKDILIKKTATIPKIGTVTSGTRDKKKVTTKKPKEDIELFSNLPDPIPRKTGMSETEKAARKRCPYPKCGSLMCDGKWETYLKNLPLQIQKSKNEKKRRKINFDKKHQEM